MWGKERKKEKGRWSRLWFQIETTEIHVGLGKRKTVYLLNCSFCFGSV